MDLLDRFRFENSLGLFILYLLLRGQMREEVIVYGPNLRFTLSNKRMHASVILY